MELCVAEIPWAVKGAQLGTLGPNRQRFPGVDMCWVFGSFHLLKLLVSAWVFLVRILRDARRWSSRA